MIDLSTSINIDRPHVFSGFALQKLVELLVSIAAPVVEIPLVIAVTIAPTEFSILIEIVKHGCDSGVFFDLGASHVLLLLDLDGWYK
jgi:hypothetical protein